MRLLVIGPPYLDGLLSAAIIAQTPASGVTSGRQSRFG